MGGFLLSSWRRHLMASACGNWPRENIETPSLNRLLTGCLNSINHTPAHMLIAFHKPYGVLSQFTTDGSPHKTLSAFGFPPRVYPIGRLDADSEGLLLLSDEPAWNDRLLNPRRGHGREYWVQVEGTPTKDSLAKLQAGLFIQGEKTKPCQAWRLEPQPLLEPRIPPIRVRKSIPDTWIGMILTEGKNRQVRRMTAQIGHPTLRLIRVRIGNFEVFHIPLGQWQSLTPQDILLVDGVV